MRRAEIKVDEKALATRQRKAAIPQWLLDMKALPQANRKAAAKAQLTPAQLADRVAELTELVVMLLEESPLA